MMIAPARRSAAYDVGIVIGDVVGEGMRSERRHMAGGGRRVLDRNGDAVQHAQRAPGGDVLRRTFRLGHRFVNPDRGEAVEARLHRQCPLHSSRDHVDR